MPRLHPFRKPQVCGKSSALSQKCDFGTRENYSQNCSRNLFRADETNFREGRGNPNGFPLAAAYFRAHRKGMPRLHPFRKPRHRQIGVRGAKAWFCLRESFYKSIHEICFELTKQISVSGRALPSAARFEGHTVKGTPFLYAAKLPAEALAPRGAAPRRGASLPLQAGLPLRKDVCISV